MEEIVELKGEYSDFIGSYENVLDYRFCDEVISTFDYYQEMNSVYCEDDQFPNANAGRFDWAIDLYTIQQSMNGEPVKFLNDVLNDCLAEYTQVFGHMKQVPLYTIAQKVQKTPAGGGYHVWHDEQSSLGFCNRSLVWMIYLNDDYEGGETEFLYYKKRIQPSKGTLLIWPAGMTHAHRGNMVLTNEKYVITGWFHLGQ